MKVCALTGVAARLVGGGTLHSTFKLPVQKDGRIVQMLQLTGNYLRIMRQQWKDIQFLFIDEISMVPYEMLCMIESRLRQVKNPDELFGGINIIVFGISSSCLQFADTKFSSNQNVWFQRYIFGGSFLCVS